MVVTVAFIEMYTDPSFQMTMFVAAQVKIIDFGYGSRYIGALPMRTKCGTPYTMAPEVIREVVPQCRDTPMPGPPPPYVTLAT